MITIDSYRGVQFNQAILTKVIVQLNKDLQITGFNQCFDRNLTIEVFIEETIAFFESLLLSNAEELYPLLYRIDVNQEAIEIPNKNIQEKLAQLVIAREFQKVVLKKEFSSS